MLFRACVAVLVKALQLVKSWHVTPPKCNHMSGCWESHVHKDNKTCDLSDLCFLYVSGVSTMGHFILVAWGIS